MTSAAVQTLISNPQDAAADRSACYGDGTANTNVLGNFTLTTSGETNAIPTEAHGRYVRLLPNGSTIYYYFSFASGATIAAAPAATQAGARAATQGEGPYAAGSVIEVRIPNPPTGGRVYFCRLGGTASQSVQMVLADGTVGLTGP